MPRRLDAISSYVPACPLVVDVGSDHGLLGIALLKDGTVGRVVNVDKRKAPLASGAANVVRAGLEDRVTSILSDGFADVPKDLGADCVVVAGLGAATVVRIVADCPLPWKWLVLQPTNGAAPIRAWAKRMGYGVDRETVVSDGGFYELLRVVKSGGTPVATEEDVLFGPLNMVEKSPEFLACWRERQSKVLRNLAKGARNPRLLAAAQQIASVLDGR